MSTFASTTKEGLAWFISSEANRIAREEKIKGGKIAVCLRPVLNDVCTWLYDDMSIVDYVSVHSINPKADSENKKAKANKNTVTIYDELGNLSDDKLTETIDDAIERRKTKLFDDEYLKCHSYGMSYCYPIYDKQNNPKLYLVLIVNSSATPVERDILFGLRDAIEKWCKENKLWTPKISPRPVGMTA